MAAFSPAGMMLFGDTTSLMDRSSPADQVAGETEEERRKRLAALQASRNGTNRPGGIGAGFGGVLSAAGMSLGF